MHRQDVDKYFKATFQNKYINKGQIGRCVREKHVAEIIGNVLLVNFGVISIWCFKHDLMEVESL
ncbi:hypothetical protein D3P96_08335 [Weissella viridescens]|uniref:Uncharacterized protein n=1 Tax=Weissella viridescens TaxID=1629 RepID=A0A3P2RIQ0_WEIVI|nr:hypothetical protein D3P96_08335 [Weissella viridescens]